MTRLRVWLGLGLLRLSYFVRNAIAALLTGAAAPAYNARIYARRADLWADMAEGGLDAFETGLLDRYRVTSGRALCLACGAGREVFPLVQRGLQVWGVDSVQGMLDRAAALGAARGLHATFVRADMTALDLPGVSFDYVFVWNQAYTLVATRRRRVDMLSRAYRLLNSGGMCLVSFITKPPTAREVLAHRRYWRPLAWLTGNPSFELGDRIVPDDGFAHFFVSDDDVRAEAEAAGFRCAEFVANGAFGHYAILFR